MDWGLRSTSCKYTHEVLRALHQSVPHQAVACANTQPLFLPLVALQIKSSSQIAM